MTDEGQAFLKYAEQALENAKQAIAAARHVAQAKNNQIHIGFLKCRRIENYAEYFGAIKTTYPRFKNSFT